MEIIYRTGLTGSPVETIVSNDKGESEVIALDLSGGKMYWASWRGDEIRRANLDGSQVETLVAGLDRIYDLAGRRGAGAKYTGRRMGWGLSGPTSTALKLKPSFTESSKGVALDLGGGKIYWTDSD